MNESQEIYFPFRMSNYYFEVRGKLHYPDMNITIDSAETEGNPLHSEVLQEMENICQDELYAAYVDWIC